jgi:hypothetical protein
VTIAVMPVLHRPLPDVAGAVCEALLVQAHYYRGQLVNEANALFLRFGDRRWHRVFIQAGVVFWQVVDTLDSPDQDRHHYTLTDLGAAHGCAGKRLRAVRTADLPDGGEVRLVFDDGPTVVLHDAGDRSRVVVEAADA